MARALILFSTLALLLAGCAVTDTRNAACAAQAQGGLHWGYYPGYGCGPVPRAQTLYP
jgi:hypothetical protein